uniref:Uncharacterized protein n=2 Tax=Physcomitrium patens TaxID=3218 RepID=A0A7I3ZGP7_PHYPA
CNDSSGGANQTGDRVASHRQGWMDGWMDGWMNLWMNLWMN